jgi:malate synthase
MNSGADCWMADFEDSLAPSWLNLLQGQANLIEVNKKTLSFKEGPKEYKLNEKIATLIVRTRGWHLDEKNLIIDGEPISGAIFDFAVYFFHNYKIRADNGLGGVFYYLPKMESYKEAALWNDVFLTVSFY